MIEVDPRFKASSARSRKRRHKRIALLAGAGAGSVAVLSLFFWLLVVREGGDPADLPLDGSALVQVELEGDESAAAAPVRGSTAFVDIPGDPMILTFAEGAVARGRRVAGTEALPVYRVGPMRPDRLTLVGDDLIAREQRLMTTLPSSREDFAFFQAQRSAAFDTSIGAAQPAAIGGEDLGDFGDSWGESLETGRDGADFFRETLIQNTTSISYVRPEQRRRAIYEDLVLRVRVDQPFEEVLTSNGFPPALAAKLAADASALRPVFKTIPAGSVLAIRLDEERGKRPLQISLYVDGSLAGSLTRLRDGRVRAGADPWIGQDLSRLGLRDDTGDDAVDAQVRLLDALYSAAIRNGIPTTLVGEAISLISQAHDLEGFASDGDKMSFLYAPEGRLGAGQILFIGIDGPSGRKSCYVVATRAGGYSCAGQGGMGVGMGGGLVTPVSGTMSSPFGPRRHPIFKTVKNHNGVDWAAPTGTPVMAALDGQVKSAGVGGGYGNLIILSHQNGLETRYAHLNAFAEGLKPGNPVTAGDLIGYVGTTGRSTGPHLHFELWSGGQPVNPLTYGGGGSGSRAVDALVEQIIKVESAGIATARNSRSTATGLGQFIESTWLRMMRDYEPELVATMSRADLLALRTDPELSRRMVMNLARENESYLKTRGHQVTAGRLYLAHFLGPVGADRALKAPDEATVLEIMGAAVVNANPFLRGYKIADLEAWADRKMRGRGQAAPTVVASAPRLTAEDREFMRIVDLILQEAS
ncbi:peptidoglycan DD-metalloendopeptidase family protein [Aestuariibius sp. 2305UL40-4]|uniref:peptidoglycan DD-metalloendopeptidase family protein n=1 Tax=Aestuariibius violaceus TaxID=3234132 RepID=UPI00345E2AC6